MGIVTITDEMVHNYLEQLGEFCPNCGDGSIDRLMPEEDDGNVWAVTSCLVCNAEWMDVYNVSTIVALTVPDKPSMDAEEAVDPEPYEVIIDSLAEIREYLSGFKENDDPDLNRMAGNLDTAIDLIQITYGEV